jgi:hypothetical protein
MANLVQIANMALSEVAEQTITTIDDATTPARYCKEFIYQAIREALASGVWKCARKPAVLNQLADAPEFGWEYAYQLPTDYVGMFSFNDVTSDERWQEMFEVQGNQLLTDESTVSLIYIRDLTQNGNDVNLMPPLLTKACYVNLASKIAWPIQQSRTLKESLEQSYEVALRKAKAADAREDFRPVINPASGSRWLPARGC